MFPQQLSTMWQSKRDHGMVCNTYFILSYTKAELLEEGIFFLINLFARDVLVMKKLEIEKIKPTFIISVLKVEY